MRRLGKGIPRFFRGQRGISLIETLVAVSILAAIGVAFMTAMSTAYKNVGILDEKTQAKALAHSQLEQIKAAPYPVEEPFYGTDVYPVTVNLPPQYSMSINATAPTKIGTADNYTSLEELWGPITTIQEITISVSHGGKPVFSLAAYKGKVE